MKVFSLYQDSRETRTNLSCCARLERCNRIESGFQAAELAKPEQEILCSSCKAIGAAYAIGKEAAQLALKADVEIARLKQALTQIEASLLHGYSDKELLAIIDEAMKLHISHEICPSHELEGANNDDE